MQVIERDDLKTLTNRLNNEPRRFIQVLFGPRQVGKTTMVKQFVKKSKSPCLMISADTVPNNDEGWIGQQWDNARLQYATSEHKELVFIIDEVQKIANWSEQVKAEWDADSKNDINIKILIVIAGTNIHKIIKPTVFLTAFGFIYLGYFSLIETQGIYDISADEFVFYGNIPKPYEIRSQEHRWKDFINNSLSNSIIHSECLLRNKVSKPWLLQKFFA